MVNTPRLVSGTKSVNSVKISFRLPYFTQWGETLVVCGSVPVLGSWNVKKGVLLSPFHEGSELIWSGSITVPKGFQCEYTYYVVDDKRNIVRWEMGKKHELTLPEGVLSGQEIEFRDLWQVASFLSIRISLCLLQAILYKLAVQRLCEICSSFTAIPNN